MVYAKKMSDEEKGKLVYQVLKMVSSATGYTVQHDTEVHDIFALGVRHPVAHVCGATTTTITITHMEDSLTQQVDQLLKANEVIKEQRDELAKQLKSVKDALGLDDDHEDGYDD